MEETNVLTTELAEAKEWAQDNYGVIGRYLRDALETEVGFYLGQGMRSRKEVLRRRGLTEDIFSNAYCPVVPSIVEELNDSIVRDICGTLVYWCGIWGKQETPHWYFMYGDVVIDPTLGQAVNLDRAVKRFPELFVGRVAVAYSSEIYKTLKVRHTQQIHILT